MLLSLQRLLEHLIQLHTPVGEESAATIAVSLIPSIIRHKLLTEAGKSVNLALVYHLVIVYCDNPLPTMDKSNDVARLDADLIKSKLAAIIHRLLFLL